MTEAFVIAFFALSGIIFQTVVGFGVSSFITPALLVYFNPPIAVTVTLLMATVLCLVVLYSERNQSELSWPIVVRLFIAAVPGLLIGSYVVTRIDKSLLQIIVGLLIILGAVVQEHIFPRPTKQLAVSRGINVSGFVAGLLNASAAQAAPPLVLWMRTHKSRPNQLRHNLAAAFILMNLASIMTIHFLKHGSLSAKGFEIFLLLLPLVILGNVLGRFINTKIDMKHHRSIVLLSLIVIGLVTVGLGFFARRS